VGALHNHVTNWGLLGGTIHGTPSGRWPGDDGANLLFGAGLWVGGRVLGEQLVTTGYPTLEMQSTEALADTIYPMRWGQLSAQRYPLPLFDDDEDGLEDEDPPNGLDDDNDGRIDEDGAGVGNQHFRCEMNDTYNPSLPQHTPLNLEIIQESYQWSHPAADDFIGYTFRVSNQGVTAIQDVHLGVFSDFDIGGYSDDLAGSYRGRVASTMGDSVDVQIGYMTE